MRHLEKVSALELIKKFPYEEIQEIAKETNVDYKAKKLHGIDLMLDCIGAMLSSSQVSQRVLAYENGLPILTDTPLVSSRVQVCHSSCSERLDNINLEFFERSYRLLCNKYRCYVPDDYLDEMSITRVDSTMVAESANKLVSGFRSGGNAQKSRRQLKYTMAYNGVNVTAARVFTQKRYSSDNAPISIVIHQCLRKREGMSEFYLFDRGLLKVDDLSSISKISQKEGVYFVGRLKANRLIKETGKIEIRDAPNSNEEVEVVEDYTGYLRASRSNKWDESTEYRFIRVRFKAPRPKNPSSTRRHARHYDEEMLLITNNMTASALEIFHFYKKRWDIEVFFKFLKQDLSFSHFISTNVHGIKVMLYMTLIVALLIKIFSIANDIGPKLAKFAIYIEIAQYLNNQIQRLKKENAQKEKEIKYLEHKLLAKTKSSDH